MLKKLATILAVVFVLSFLTFSVGCKKEKASVTSYEIDVTLEGNKLSGSQTVNYFNDTDTVISELKFNLYGNAFRKDAKYSPVNPAHLSQSYPHGLNYGDMSVEKVSSGEKGLEFKIEGEDENILAVTLDAEVYPDESVSVSMDFTLNLANIVARTGVNDSAINLANFYPILCARGEDGFYECVYYANGDPFYSDMADYTVKITLDEKYVVASSGKKVAVIDNGNTLTATYKIASARSFAFVLSDKFSVMTDDTTGVNINYYYYDDDNPKQSMDYAVKSIKYFENTFGDYIYENYSFVQTEFVQGGMEFSALTMISDDLEDNAYGEVIVHETAHQWWQTAVGNNEIEYGFLDEGLTEYSVVLFYENHPEYSLTREVMIKSAENTYKAFCTVSDKVFGKVNTVMLRSIKDFSSEYEYVNMAYIKPCIMYDYLRQTVGENRFFKGLKNYYSEYKYKIAKPHDIVGVFEKIGADTNGFFQSFYDGKVII